MNNGNVVAVGVKQGRMYQMLFKVVLPDKSIQANITSSVKKLPLQIWHERLGHQNVAYLKDFLRSSNIDFVDEEFECDSCVEGKQHRLSFENRKEKATTCGEIIHGHVCTMPVESFAGSKYFVFFSEMIFQNIAYPMKNKSEVFDKFRIFVALMKNDCGNDVKIFRSDNGKEFVNDNMQRFMEQKGIRHHRTVRYTPEQNGCAERDNRTLVEAIRTTLISKSMDNRFWAEALNTIVYVLNRTGKSTVESKTPFKLWFEKKPNVDNLRVFGSKVFVHIPKEKRNKIDSKSIKCIFSGLEYQNQVSLTTWQ